MSLYWPIFRATHIDLCIIFQCSLLFKMGATTEYQGADVMYIWAKGLSWTQQDL